MRYNPAAMRRIAAVAVAACLWGCASFDPQPLESTSLLARAQTQIEGKLRVTVAVPTAEETKTLLGLKLWNRGIQPVWLRIDNDDDEARWLLPISLDPDYHAPLEAAYRSHYTFSSGANRKMDAYLDEQQIRLYVPPHGSSDGYVLTNLDRGVKVVNVDVLGPGGIESFLFIVDIPGMKRDTDQVDLDALYEKDDYVEVDKAELRARLEKMPRATRNKKGDREGDPLNIVLIGEYRDVYTGLVRRGWDLTEVGGAANWKTVTAFLFRSKYRYSPISPLYVFGRQQDIALQRARDNIRYRNHLRLWLTPLLYEGLPVWIGQISRDIGVKVSFKAPTITTHVIDPDIDEARVYLLQDMIYSLSLVAFGHCKGVGAASRTEPRHNLGVDPYYTDGLRVVLIFGSDSSPIDEIKNLGWEHLVPR